MSATRLVAIASLALLGAAPAHGQLRAPRGLGNFPVVIHTVSTGEVLVRWQPVLKASEYDVERCEGAALETCTMKTTPRLTANQLLQVPDNLSASGTYLYRVTAYGSHRLPIAQGQVGYQYTAPPSAIPVAPPSGTILPILAGPSALRAWSPIPGQIHISWSVISSATRYRVVRSIVGVRNTERELGPSNAVPDNLGGYTGNQYIDVPVDLRWTYAYTVYAYVKPGATEVLTAGSPVATAKSIPFVQVSGVTYTVVPSTSAPGKLDITLRWSAVKDAEKYSVWDQAGGWEYGSTQGTWYTLRNMPVGGTTHVCVGAHYPYSVTDRRSAPCLTLTTATN